MTAAAPPLRKPPLDGLLVVELARVLAGPLAGMVLADLGASVVKVEPPGGDVTRAWRPPEDSQGESAYFLALNRRKESVVADLGTDAGRTFLSYLVSRADVLIENFLPGQLEARGLSVARWRAENPRLVVCSISGWGTEGPLAGRPGFDLLAQGASGLMWVTGPADREPHKVGVAVADVLAGWSAVTAILAALAARARDGTGAHVSTDLFASAVAGLVNVAQNALVTDAEVGRYGNAHPSIEPYRPFEASDAPFLVAVGTDAQFERLVAAAGLPGLAYEARFATSAERVRHRGELFPILAARFAEGTRRHWLETLAAAGVPCGPVAGVHEALHSAHAVANGLVLATWRPDGSIVPTVRSPIRLDGFEEPSPSAPPRLGEGRDRL